MCKKIRKSLCVALTVLTFGTAMVGCSNGSAPGTSSAAASAASSKEMKPSDYKGTLVQWGWDDALAKTMQTEFNKVYPNVKFEYTNVQDYAQKIQTTVASGGQLPDILWAEMGTRGKLFDMDIWENLEASPYNFDKNTLMDYILPLESNSKGQIVAIDNSISPAAIAYKRDLAKQYFGTDNPAELSKLFSNWNVFIEKGKEVKQKSNGKVFMFPSIGDAYTILDGQNSSPTMDGDSINITGRMKNTLSTMVRMRDSGIVDKLDMWSPAWNAAYASQNEIFFACANWSPQYQIETNDKGGKGNWGIMTPPNGAFSWGGTAFGISNQSKNKDLAWQFIKWSFTSGEGIKVAAQKEKKYPPIKNAYSNTSLISDTDPYFGGQDIGKFWFNDVVPKIKVRPITKYDTVIADTATLIQKSVISDKSMNSDAALSNFIKEVQNKVPDVTVK